MFLLRRGQGTLLLLIIILLLAACATPTATAETPGATPTTPVSTPTALPGTPSPALPSVVEVVERVRPAVVSIGVVIEQRDIFGRRIRSTASGSGVIFDPQGYVLTNNHVIEGATTIEVTLDDGRTFEPQLVGRDPPTDLAVLQLPAGQYPAVPFGDAERLQVGEWVIAIGNALGLRGGPTVTVGVVGAIDRTVTTETGTDLHHLIQTDAAINPGNSGGPLVNLNGEVVGINTAQASGAPGIGFAVSTFDAVPVVQQLLQNGEVVWPWLGIRAASLTPTTALEQELPLVFGVLVAALERGGPAQRAGLLPGDVITHLDGVQVSTLKEFQAFLRQRQIGEVVEVRFLRGERELALPVTLERFPRGL